MTEEAFRTKRLLIDFGADRIGSILDEAVHMGKRAEALKAELDAIVKFSSEYLDSRDEATLNELRNHLYRLGVWGESPAQAVARARSPDGGVPPGISPEAIAELAENVVNQDPAEAKKEEDDLGPEYLRDLIRGMELLSSNVDSTEFKADPNVALLNAKRRLDYSEWTRKMDGKYGGEGQIIDFANRVANPAGAIEMITRIQHAKDIAHGWIATGDPDTPAVSEEDLLEGRWPASAESKEELSEDSDDGPTGEDRKAVFCEPPK